MMILSEETFSYGCVMAPASDKVAEAVVRFCDENIKDEQLYVAFDDESFGRQEDIHVTVKYGLEDSDELTVRDALEGVEPFCVTLGSIKKFESEEYDVVYIEAFSDELKEINKKITNEIDCTETHNEYVPHMTVAYVLPGEADDLLERKDFNGLGFEVTNVDVSTPDGGVYPVSLRESTIRKKSPEQRIIESVRKCVKKKRSYDES